MKLRLVLAILLIWPSTVFSQEITSFISGEQLYDKCSTPPGDPDQGYCLGYIAGMSDAFHSAKLLCNSGDVTLGETLALIIRFYRAHPEEQHDLASSLGYAALQRAFPCK